GGAGVALLDGGQDARDFTHRRHRSREVFWLPEYTRRTGPLPPTGLRASSTNSLRGRPKGRLSANQQAGRPRRRAGQAAASRGPCGLVSLLVSTGWALRPQRTLSTRKLAPSNTGPPSKRTAAQGGVQRALRLPPPPTARYRGTR